MNFIDLAAQQKRIKDKINDNIARVLQHGKYIMGPEIHELEDKLSNLINVKHAVSCGSGTDALLMALMAYDVGPGDAILTTPFTFVATAEVISLLGATPVFVDVRNDTFNICPNHLAKAINAFKSMDASNYPLPDMRNKGELKLKGIIAVDLFGLPCDYDAIKTVAKEHDLFLIGDAAQSLGSEYKGVKAASIPEISCTSFFPAKPLGCYGDGGMCFTNHDHLAEKIQSIRVHGKGSEKYDNVRIGINGRLDTLQAAILLPKVDIFSEEIALRQNVARRYHERINANNISKPDILEDYKSVWAQYSLVTKTGADRSEILNNLGSDGIPTAIYYPKPLHLQTAFKHLGYKEGDFIVSEALSKRIFSIPMHPYLGEEDQDKIARCLCDDGYR